MNGCHVASATVRGLPSESAAWSLLPAIIQAYDRSCAWGLPQAIPNTGVRAFIAFVLITGRRTGKTLRLYCVSILRTEMLACRLFDEINYFGHRDRKDATFSSVISFPPYGIAFADVRGRGRDPQQLHDTLVQRLR